MSGPASCVDFRTAWKLRDAPSLASTPAAENGSLPHSTGAQIDEVYRISEADRVDQAMIAILYLDEGAEVDLAVLDRASHDVAKAGDRFCPSSGLVGKLVPLFIIDGVRTVT